MRAPRRRNLTRAAGTLGIATLAIVSCAAPAPPPPPATGTALANFTLIDGTDRAALAGQAMHIGDDGRIAWIGPTTDLVKQTSVSATDLAGAYVMPGLINLHGHVGNTIDMAQVKENHTRGSVEKELGTYASYGVTTVVSMGTDQDAVFPIRDEQRAGRPSAARLHSAGQGIMLKDGYGGLPGVNVAVATVAEAEAEVARQAAKKVDFIKLWLDDELGTMPKMPTEISRAVIDAAHKHNLRALAHVFYLEDAKRLADQGIDGFVHLVRDKPVDQALIDSMKKSGAWQVAGTLSREASFAVGGNPPYATDPFFTRGVSQKTLELFASPARLKTVASNPNYGRYPAFLETAKKNLKALYDAGVPVGFGTDAGPPGRFPGFFEHWELQLMVDAGFTPAQALASATRRSAEFLKTSDIGTLAVGRQADLVVLDGDPLADILNTRKIRAVYVAGRKTP